MVRIKNVYLCSVSADGVGKCDCYRICVEGVSSCLVVNVWRLACVAEIACTI